MWRNRFAIPGLDGQKAVLYRSRMNPSLGRNFEAMDPLECWRVWPTISPTPANIAPTSMPTTPTAYAASGRPKNGDGKYEEEQPKKRRCSPSSAGLIAKVFRVDPLICKRCVGPLKVVAYITDTVAIRRILDHLGLSPPAHHAGRGQCVFIQGGQGRFDASMGAKSSGPGHAGTLA